MKQAKIAIVYDWIDKWGGVERLLLSLHSLIPNAQFFTSYLDPHGASWAREIPIRTSFLHKLPSFIKKNRVMSVPLYPYAFESLNFSSYDLVISVSSSFAKAIITTPDTLHVSILLTPTRFLWTHPEKYLTNSFFKNRLPRYKYWDYAAAQRSDLTLSISESVRKKVLNYYKRDSKVLYPPFDSEYWKTIEKKETKNKTNDFFLLVSRLEPYKNVELVVNTFNQNRLPLVIVGKGSLSKKLRRKASLNIRFLENLTDQELTSFYLRARALIMPQEEDFGYVALEAQFFGLPVISYKKGGALETVLDKKTGIFFNEPTERSLQDALVKFQKISRNLKKTTKQYGQENVQRFSKNLFETKFLHIVNEALTQRKGYNNSII